MPVTFAILSFSFRPSTPGWMMRLVQATSSTSGRRKDVRGKGRGGEGKEGVRERGGEE